MRIVFIILSFFIIYGAIFIFNYGVLLAYYQRTDMKKCIDNYPYHKKLSFILSLPGPLSTIGVLIRTHFPTFGIKFWADEREKAFIFNKENRFYREFCRTNNSCNSPEGKCKDIW